MTEDTQYWIKEVEKAMKKGGGPFTRLMLAKHLEKKHRITHSEAMLNVSVAIEFDKDNKPRLFKSKDGKSGWWDLAGK